MGVLATVSKFEATAPVWHPFAGRRASTIALPATWGIQPSWQAGLPANVVVPASGAVFPYTIVSGVPSRVTNPGAFPNLISLVGSTSPFLTYNTANGAIELANPGAVNLNQVVQLAINLGGAGAPILSPQIGITYNPLSVLSWLPFNPISIDEGQAFPQYVTGIDTFLVDPQSVVTSITMDLAEPSAVPAVVAYFDAANQLYGYGPSFNHEGVFFGFPLSDSRDMWWWFSVPAGLVAIPLEGGDWDVTRTTAPAGTYTLIWARWDAVLQSISFGPKVIVIP